MGMFDYVNYSAPCKECGEILTGWQSKSGDCVLDAVEPETVGYFYDFCSNCQAMNEVTVESTITYTDVKFKQTVRERL